MQHKHVIKTIVEHRKLATAQLVIGLPKLAGIGTRLTHVTSKTPKVGERGSQHGGGGNENIVPFILFVFCIERRIIHKF